MDKNLEKITSDLYVDWSVVPQNIPVNGLYFECPTCFNDTISEGSNENEENS